MKYTLLTILLFFSLSAFSQEPIKVRGSVVDDEGEPAIGATVYAIKNSYDKESVHVVLTDIDGNYEITTNIDEYLLFKYLGCKDVVVKINGRNRIDVNLEEDWPDLGLPHEYYIPSLFHLNTSASFHNDTWGYAVGATVKLPYWSSERYDRKKYKRTNKWARYKYGLYNKMMRYSSIGVNLAKPTPSDNKLFPSIYYQFEYPISLKKYYYGISPFIRVGLYLDVNKYEIQSQNLEYGGGIVFWGIPILNRLPYTNLFVGYQGFNKRSEYNNLYLGLRFRFPDIPMIYY